jgi:hypothetical protein
MSSQPDLAAVCGKALAAIDGWLSDDDRALLPGLLHKLPMVLDLGLPDRDLGLDLLREILLHCHG